MLRVLPSSTRPPSGACGTVVGDVMEGSTKTVDWRSSPRLGSCSLAHLNGPAVALRTPSVLRSGSPRLATVAINPTGPGLKAFLQAAPDEPVVMLNLLRFQPDGGRESYQEYLAMFGRYAADAGATVLYYGEGSQALVAEPGQDWDAVLLVSYPTRRSFSEMVRNPDYQQGTQLRDRALVEAVLQPTVPPPTPAA